MKEWGNKLREAHLKELEDAVLTAFANGNSLAAWPPEIRMEGCKITMILKFIEVPLDVCRMLEEGRAVPFLAGSTLYHRPSEGRC